MTKKERILELLKDKSLRQVDIAERVGATKDYVSRVCLGKGAFVAVRGQVTELLKLGDLSVRQIAEKVGCDTSHVYKVKRKLPKELQYNMEQRVLKLLKKGVELPEIRLVVHCSTRYVNMVAKEHGIKPSRIPSNQIFKDNSNTIKDLYIDNHNQYQIADIIGTHEVNKLATYIRKQPYFKYAWFDRQELTCSK